MKKLVALLLALVLCLSLCACGKGGNEGESSQAGGNAFVKPENYASVLVVSINPEIRLYLDKDSNVLAVEPVNEDAKAVVEKLDIKDKSLTDAIESIVSVSNQEGFVKENADVKFQITEKKDDSVNTETVLDSAKQSAEKIATELKISVNVKVSVNITNNTTVNNNITINNNINVDNSQHHHDFSKATCTEPAKCACGVTRGEPAPHNYVSGVCADCKKADPDYVPKYTSVKNKVGSWNLTYTTEKNLYVAFLVLYGNDENLKTKAKIGDSFSTLPQEVWEDIRGAEEYAKFDNKEYYMANGESAPLVQVNENKTTVTVVDGNGKRMILERKNETTLIVKSVEKDFIAFGEAPVGSILTFSAN